MALEETMGAVILALDLYRIALVKQCKTPDPSRYPGLIDQGKLLIEGIQDVEACLTQGESDEH